SFFQAEDGIRDDLVTGVQTCALPICVRTRGYRDDFFLKVLAAAQSGDPAMLAHVLRRQRVHLLTELRSLADARGAASGSPVVAQIGRASCREGAEARGRAVVVRRLCR